MHSSKKLHSTFSCMKSSMHESKKSRPFMINWVHRLHYSSKLIWSDSQSWEKDNSPLSRFFNTSLTYCCNLHARKVFVNISWYSDRFDMYHASMQSKIFCCRLNSQEGYLPAIPNKIFGFLDCTDNSICKLLGNNNLQNAFYNGYNHGHFTVW